MLKKGLQALRGYSTHINEHRSPINQCLLSYWGVFGEFVYCEEWKKIPETIWENCSCWRYRCSLGWRILHEESLRSYHIQRVQAFTSPDYRSRAVFCQWLLTKCFLNSQFVANILFTYDTGFTRDGIVNLHNTRVWVDDNLHTTVTSKYQHRFSIKVWVAISGNQSLGPVALPNRLMTVVWHRFLLNDLPVPMEHVPLRQRQHTWFMHDGAPPLCLCIFREHKNQTFGEQ
jgi:hypothetical protein